MAGTPCGGVRPLPRVSSQPHVPPDRTGNAWSASAGALMVQEPRMLQAQACPSEPAVRHAPEHRSPGKEALGDWCLWEGLDASRAAGRAVSSGCGGLPGRPLWAPLRSSPTAALLLPERSQDSTAVALSDSSSTQDFFSEPASSQEGSRRPCAEKRPPAPISQAGLPGKDLPATTEEKGTEP